MVTYSNYSVLLIDNASTDESIEILQEEFPEVNILPLDLNYGYSGGMNMGIEHLKSDHPEYVLFLNNDITVAPDFLDCLIDGERQFDPDNIYGSQIYYSSNKEKIWFSGGNINFALGWITHQGIRKHDDGSFSENIFTDYITGCCMLTSWDTVDTLGGFNSSFNMYGEDVDYCIRAQKTGKKCLVIPSSKIWHKVSASIGGNWSWKKNIRKFKSVLKLMQTHASITQKITGYPSIFLYSLIMVPVLIIKQISLKLINDG